MRVARLPAHAANSRSVAYLVSLQVPARSPLPYNRGVVIHTAVPASSWAGQQIDHRLTLQEWLGSTGSGDVFRTEWSHAHPPDQSQSAQPAAIFLIPADPDNEAQILPRWESARSLDHPHVQRIFECGRTTIDGSDLLYLVTELPEEALNQVLPDRALTPGEAREMLEPILDALQYLHTNHLVHAHLEPANLLVVGDRLKLSADSLLSAGSLRSGDHRPRIYDAPETETGALTPAADIWSLGITLMEALTQETPHWERSSGRDPLVPVTVPQPFAEIARRCLRIDPAQRCTLAEIHEILNPPAVAPAQYSAQPIAAQAPGPISTQTPRPAAREAQFFRRPLRSVEEEEPRPRFPILIVTAAAVLLLMLIVGIVAYSHRSATVAGTADQPAAANVTQANRPIKPLPPPSGPTLKGEVAQRVIPEIPERASRTIRGKVDVTIKAVVDHTGAVMNASIESVGRSRYFANQALDAARKWRFRPARIHGQPASSVWQLRFIFKSDGTEVTPTEQTP